MTTHYSKARYSLSAHTLRQLPPDSGMEVAFAGRSNTGKSSVINVLTGQRRLARVSKTPGRTQLLNVFELDPKRRIVDLPGYGYARVPVAMQRHWGELLEGYFGGRESLRGLVLVVDIRHGFKPTDLQMQDWCRANALPCHVLLNKADKLSRGAALNQLHRLRGAMAAGTSLQIFSALRRTGLEELTGTLDGWFAW